MKILYIITALGAGGAEHLLLDVCSGLCERHEVTVVYLRDKTDLEAPLRDMGVDTRYIDLEKRGFFGCLRALRRMIREIRPDIVHTHLPAADTVGRLAGILSPGVRVFSTSHSTELWKLEKNMKSRLLRLYNRFTINRFKKCALVAVSRAVMDFCMEHECIRRDKIEIIYNFIDYNNPLKTQAGFVPDFITPDMYPLIIIARLHAAKGHHILLEAMAKLVAERGMRDLHLIVVGDGETRADLEAQTARLSLDGHVHFMGIRRNVYDYLRVSKLLIMPSVIEGFGLALLEAAYCGVPALASDNPALREIMRDGENGMLFRCGDAGDLAEKIAAIHDGEVDVAGRLANAREFCMTLTKENHIAALEALYRGEG